jgi:hypothetical protein
MHEKRRSISGPTWYGLLARWRLISFDRKSRHFVGASQNDRRDARGIGMHFQDLEEVNVFGFGQKDNTRNRTLHRIDPWIDGLLIRFGNMREECIAILLRVFLAKAEAAASVQDNPFDISGPNDFSEPPASPVAGVHVAVVGFHGGQCRICSLRLAGYYDGNHRKDTEAN